MIGVDIAARIEWPTGSATGGTLAGRVPDRADWLVPTSVQPEAAKWLTREAGEDSARQLIAVTRRRNVVAPDTGIAVAAAEAGRARRRASADIVDPATARAPGASENLALRAA